MIRHGHTAGHVTSPTYHSWTHMKSRCLDPKNDRYDDYGGRGIQVCARWLKFENFLADMGVRAAGSTLDRYPNLNGNYEPGNCRWATAKQQQENTRVTMIIEHDGERKTLIEWAQQRGLTREALYYRLRRGWTVSDALNRPCVPKGKLT